MKNNSFVKQAAILAAATLFVRFIGFLYRLPLTHIIGDEGIGLYSVGYQFYLFMLVMSSAGLPNAISKMVSERVARREYRNAHGVFKAAMVIAVIFGATGSLLLWFFAGHFEIWFNHPGSAYAIRALSPTVLIVAVMAVYRGYFQGMNNAAPTALSQVVEQIFKAIFSVWIAFLFIDQIERAAAGGTAGTGIGALLGLLTLLAIYKFASPKLHKRIRNDRTKEIEKPGKAAKEVLSTAFPIIFGAAIYSMANFVDMAMIPSRLAASGEFTMEQSRVLFGQFSGKFVVLTTLPVAVSSALAAAVLPSIAGSNVTHDYKSVAEKIRKALRISTFISIPAAVGLGVMARPILLLLFPAFPEGAILLQVGAVSVVFLSLNQIATGALQGIGKIMIPVFGAIIGVLFKIPINYVLIARPEINVVGAVISTCVCYFLASGFNMIALKKYSKVKIDWIGIFIKPASGAAVMGMTCFIAYYVLMAVTFGHNGISTLTSVGLGVVMYFLMMVLFGAIHEEDMKRIPLVRRLIK